MPVVVWTHEVREAGVRDALKQIDALAEVSAASSVILEEDL